MGKIIQIIPATGWWAEYKMEDGQVQRFPLIGWGLCDDEDIVPLDVDSSGYVDNARDAGNFVGVVYEPPLCRACRSHGSGMEEG